MTSLADKLRASAISLYLHAENLADDDFDSAARLKALAEELTAEADREDAEDAA